MFFSNINEIKYPIETDEQHMQFIYLNMVVFQNWKEVLNESYEPAPKYKQVLELFF